MTLKPLSGEVSCSIILSITTAGDDYHSSLTESNSELISGLSPCLLGRSIHQSWPYLSLGMWPLSSLVLTETSLNLSQGISGHWVFFAVQNPPATFCHSYSRLAFTVSVAVGLGPAVLDSEWMCSDSQQLPLGT